MKIAIVCFNLSWQAGGVRLIYSFAHALMKRGHRVSIYAPELNEAAYPDLRQGLDIRVIVPPEPIHWQYTSTHLLPRIREKLARGRALRAAGRKIAEAMDGDFDVVNLHDFSYQIAPLYRKKNPRACPPSASASGACRQARIIWTMNDPPYMYLPKEQPLYDVLSRFYNWYKDLAERRFFRAIEAAVVLVERNKRWVEKRGMRGKVVWSGIEFERFYAKPKQIEGKRTVTVLGVGALNKYRRFEDIIAAVRILRAKHIDAQALIVCKNIWKEDAYAAELQDFTRSEGVEQQVTFRFEGASDKELRGLYALSDFFVLPIHLPPPRNGFGWQLVPFEAMAAGTPVIVSNKIDVIEALKDGETACFVDPLSPEQIAEKIQFLIDHPDAYAALARAGQDFVKTKLTWYKYVDDVLALCDPHV